MPQPEQPTSRRAARLAAEAAPASPARRSMPAVGRRGLVVLAGLAALVVLVVVIALTRPGGAATAPEGGAAGVMAPTDAVALPDGAGSGTPATGLPVPAQSGVAAASCDDPAVSSALAEGRDADVITAFGGGAAFRAAVVSGAAPCIDLGDPHRLWIVVDKQRPLNPIDVEPTSVVAPADMQRTVDGRLQPAAAEALTALVAAAANEGAGAIGLNSAYRSFASQTRTYNGYVNTLGRAAADQQSARPGFSEHQTGLATDVAACDGGCGAIEAFGGTPQGAWVAENAWRFGYIVRYESGYTATTGYEAEPWHLRYIGPELAKAYHEGGFHTLEDFFGLPAAPDY
ncbi:MULTISPECIES: M15 family metallopeptidase [Microbacterium]|nr:MULTISPECIES: M15 family metallopeptidase [Microbacterium]